jgi:hypothetical protein
VDDFLVAASARGLVGGKGSARPIGLRHAYRDEDAQTLCGLTVRYLYPVEKAKWSPKTPQRCPTCDAQATTD